MLVLPDVSQKLDLTLRKLRPSLAVLRMPARPLPRYWGSSRSLPRLGSVAILSRNIMSAFSFPITLAFGDSWKITYLINFHVNSVTTFFLSVLSLMSWFPCWARVYSAICSSMSLVSTPSPASHFDSSALHSELFLSAPPEIAQNILVEIQDRKRLGIVENILNNPRTEHFCHQ